MRIRHDRVSAFALLLCSAPSYIRCIRFLCGAAPCLRNTSRKNPRDKTMTLKSIASKISSWRRYRDSVRELSRLTDRELNDLGISRGDIEFVARKSLRARSA